MLIFFALIIGLTINYFTGGFTFNQNLCIVAGLFLIMPSLLKFHFKDLIYFKNHKKIFLLNLLFNFSIIPAIFLLIGYLFFGASPIVFAFLLLGLIPGGGLLISWVMKNNGNIKLTFSLFLVNLFLFSLIFIPFAQILDNVGNKITEQKTLTKKILTKENKKTQNYFNYPFNNYKNSSLSGIIYPLEKKEKPKGCVITKITKNLGCPILGKLSANKSAFIALFILIIFPFIISRFILISNKLTNFLLPKIKIISTIATFFIISYIFSIKEVHNIFTTDFQILIKISIAITIIYFLIYTLTYKVLNKIGNNPDTIAFFWNSVTRFLTLGLIFSFFYVTTFGIEFLLVFVIAYFVQIIGANIMQKIIKK